MVTERRPDWKQQRTNFNNKRDRIWRCVTDSELGLLLQRWFSLHGCDDWSNPGRVYCFDDGAAERKHRIEVRDDDRNRLHWLTVDFKTELWRRRAVICRDGHHCGLKRSSSLHASRKHCRHNSFLRDVFEWLDLHHCHCQSICTFSLCRRSLLENRNPVPSRTLGHWRRPCACPFRGLG